MVTENPLLGSIATTEEEVIFHNSGDMRLIFTGYAPTVSIDPISDFVVSVPKGTLSITEESPFRAFGLQLLSDAPVTYFGAVAQPALAQLSFNGQGIAVQNSSLDNPVISIPKGELNASSVAINIGTSVSPGKGEISFASDPVSVLNISAGSHVIAVPTGNIIPKSGSVAYAFFPADFPWETLSGTEIVSNSTFYHWLTVFSTHFIRAGHVPTLKIDSYRQPATADVSFTGYAPTVSLGITTPATRIFALFGIPPTVTISNDNIAQVGTMIENLYDSGDYDTRPEDHDEIDDRTGFRLKPGEAQKEYTGNLVRRESLDQLLEPGRVRPEILKGAVRPEPKAGDETFIETAVTVDDL